MISEVSRVNRSKVDAKASYDKLSRWYDVVAGSSEKKYREMGLRKLNAQPGERVLEIGYGTGHCILALAQAVGPTGKVFGLDISDGMRAIAVERARQAGMSEWVDLRVGDGSSLPFEPASLDAVFMSFTLELFDTPEIPVVLRQCRAALRPDGRIALVSMTKDPAQPGFAVRLYEWFHEKWPSAVDCRPIFARQSLEETGFQILDIEKTVMWGLPVEIILAASG